MLIISVFKKELNNQVIFFIKKAYNEEGRIFEENAKDSDLQNIDTNYMTNGCFWILTDTKERIVGTIALRKLSSCWEVRRFFVAKKYQKQGYGSKLLNTLLYYAFQQNITSIKASVMAHSKIAQNTFINAGFAFTTRYSNSRADIFFKIELTRSIKYDLYIYKLKEHFQETLILNPTENIPLYDNREDTYFFDSLYVSENHRNSLNKIIFAGRKEYIDFFQYVKNEWCRLLGAYSTDLKTLSGLQAHTILFMSIIKQGDIVMILPEVCGGHYCTEKILNNIGARTIHMIANNADLCIDRIKTEKLIYKHNPQYIFVDRSEGIYYEDFSWLKKFDNCYKIFDASQYLTQILIKEYQNPFDMGFDMILSTLHKNYPGPQKGIICVFENSLTWEKYLSESKTYFSNTHPASIALSLAPLLSFDTFKEYASSNSLCSRLLEKELILHGIPIAMSNNKAPKTMHTWILGKSQHFIYDYYLKLEQLGFLINYRLLPYELGYGLRLGTSAAVRSGLKSIHIKELARIMAEVYYNNISHSIRRAASNLIKQIKTSTAK